MSATTPPTPVKRSQRIRKVIGRDAPPLPPLPRQRPALGAARRPAPVAVRRPAAKLRRCGLCSLNFPSADECALHIINVHMLDLKLCGKCSRAFVSPKQLQVHFERHKRRSYNIFSCAHCTVHFANVQSPFLLERHEFEKHEDERPGILLKRYLPYLSYHLNMSFERFVEVLRCRTTNFVCRVCQYKCSELREYLDHLNLKCKKNHLKYVCDRCINVYTHKIALVRHFKENSRCASGYVPSLLPKKQKYYKCRFCSKKGRCFASKAELDAHTKLCNRYTCTKCSLVFESMDDYNEHHASTHKDSLKIHNCMYCRMEFISKSLLDRHTKQHERYNCLECGKKFRTPKPLLTHIKTAHPSVEPYRCVPCDVTFKEGLHFKTHIVQHNEKGLVNFDRNFIVTFTFATKDGGAADMDGSAADKDGSAADKDGSGGDNDGTGGDGDMDGSRGDKDGSATDKDGIAADNDGSDDEYLKVAKGKKEGKKDGSGMKSDSRDEEEGVRKRRPRNQNRPKRLVTAAMMMRDNRASHLICRICNKQAPNQKSYSRHAMLHLRQGAKQCVHCARMFADKHKHDEHVRTAHGKTEPATKLHQYLKERAERKMAALRASRRTAVQRRRPPPPPPQPFKIRMRCVARPTYDIIQRGVVRTTGTSVKVTQLGEATEQKPGDLTLQRYVESFQAENGEAAESAAPQSSSVKRLTMNKSLKIRSLRSAFTHHMFKIQARKFKERKIKEGAVRLSRPVPYTRAPESEARVTVTVRKSEPRPPTLNYGEVQQPVYEDVYDADYFETDDDNVAQIEINSTPIHKEITGQRKKKYVVELGEEEPTTEEIESKLAEVCQKLDVPLAKSDLHIGQLINQEPFFKIVNVKKVLKKQKKQQSEELMRKRLEQIKIGTAHMVSVNPLQHLMDKANIRLEEPMPPRSVRVTPAE